MSDYPPTIVLRHRKENLKKCSLTGLQVRPDFLFFRYPLVEVPPYMNYVLLSLDADIELSEADQHAGLLIIDATWRYAEKMNNQIPHSQTLIKRRLPSQIVTAYPRRQDDCSNPKQGLASIEAIFCAYVLMKRTTVGLLDLYHWKDSFLEKNSAFLLS